MEFDNYLLSKKIDPALFKMGDTKQYESFKVLFDQMHPESFTQQKLFLINKLRRAYQLLAEDMEKKPAKAKSARPKMIARPKTN